MFSPSVCVGTIRLQHGFVMQNLAYVSTEMATSIGVHGGAQQLLDILQAGFQQVGSGSHGCLCTCIKLSTTSWAACAPASSCQPPLGVPASAKQQERQAIQRNESAA